MTPVLSPERAALARSAVERVNELYEVEAVYLSGSIAIGLDNVSSDVDLVAIVSSSDDRTSPLQEIDLEGDGFICDTEVFSRAGWQRIVESLNAASLTVDGYSRVFAHRAALRNFCRLRLGVPLQGADTIADLARQVPEDTLRRLYVAFHASQATIYVRDAWGAAAAGDMVTALDASYTALKNACEAALGGVGSYYMSAKFTARRFAEHSRLRAVAPDVSAAFFADSRLDGASPSEVVTRRLRLAGWLTGLASLHGWHSELEDFPREPDGDRRSADYSVARFDDGVLVGGAVGWRVTVPTALAWLLANEADVAGAIATATGVDRDRIAEWLPGVETELRARGLLR